MKKFLPLLILVAGLVSCKKDEKVVPGVPMPIVRHLYITGATASEVGVYVARATQSNQEYNWTTYQGDTLTLTLNVGGLQSSIYRKDTIRFIGNVSETKQVTAWLEGLSAFTFTLDPANNGQVAYMLVTDW